MALLTFPIVEYDDPTPDIFGVIAFIVLYKDGSFVGSSGILVNYYWG